MSGSSMKLKSLFGGLALCLAATGLSRAEDTGPMLWSFDTGQIVQSSPVVGADGTIYVGSDSGRLYAITPSGGPKWTFEAGANIIAAPAIAPDGTICAASVDRKLC